MGTSYKDRLEGGYQYLRIRKLKGWIAAGMIAATSALIAFSLLAAGASAKPLFMPVDAFLPVLLIMLFIGAVLQMFLRSLEVKYARKDSQRYLMIKNSMSRATWFLVIGIAVAVVLLVPATRVAIDASITAPPVVQSLRSGSSLPMSFENQDGLGLTRYVAILVTLTAGSGMTVVVQRGTGTPQPFPLTAAVPTVSIPFDAASFALYTVTFQAGGGNVGFTYRMERGVLPDLFLLVPIIAIAFAVANAGFIVYLRPLREKYEKASIYSIEYAQRVGSGERLYTEDRAPVAAPRAGPVPAAPTAYAPAPSTPGPPPVIEIPLAIPPPPPEPTASDLFAEGASLFSQGEYDAAVERFDEALGKEPRSQRTLLAKGNALLHLGRTADALQAYDRILAFDRGNLEALVGTAQAYLADRRWRNVIDLADTYLAMKPGDAEMLTFRGDAQLALGKRSEAQISYEAALLKRPGDPDILARIERAKVDIASLQSRALIASASGNLEQAMALFDDVLKVEPENANALVGKSVALRRAGRIDEALESLHLVLGRQPGHGGALLNRGRILEERGDLEDALEAYDKLIELNPRDPDAWVAQGDVLAKMGREDDALKSYAEALKIAPSDEDTKGKMHSLETARAGESQLLRELFTIRGIGPAKAKALRDAGFHTADDFRKATEDDLMKVRGITRKVASDLIQHFSRGGSPGAQP